MQQKRKKTTTEKYAIAIISCLIFSVLPCCVSPNAVKTEIATVRDNLSRLEKVVEQKADNNIVAESIDQVKNEIIQTTQVAENLVSWRKTVEAQTVNYGGAGYVVVGTGVIVLIFVGAGLLLVRAFMRRGTLLNLVTEAVKQAESKSPGIAKAVKDCIRQEVADGRFTTQDKNDLGNFAKKCGTLIKH